jgi:hypothetical protein
MDSQIDGNPRRSRKLGGWILFIACLLLLSLGATPYHKVADSALIAIRLSLVFILSALVVRERWNHRRDVPGGRGQPYDSSESVLQRMRRWYYDDELPKM